MTEKEIIRQAMSILGRISTPAKRKAARINGAKGGRPRGKTSGTHKSYPTASNGENK